MKKLLESKFIQKYWHILILFLFSLLPLVWFVGKGGAIINGVDTNFPLDPAVWLNRRFYMWNNLSNGGTDFSFAPAGIFFHIIQFIPHILGLGLQSVEKVSLVFWFGVIIVNSYIFSGNFVNQSKLLRLLFVCLYSLNIYMFNSWENVKVSNLSLVAAIPLLIHIFIQLKDRYLSYSRAGVLLIFASLILSGAGINPAYYITALIVLFIFAITYIISGESAKNIFKVLFFIVGIITIISSYWILPTISFVFRTISQSASIGSIGFNNWIDSLSENTSIINVLRLQGAWDWYAFDSVSKLPLYLPYVVNYFYRLPFVLFSFVIPILTLVALIFANKSKVSFYISFAIMLVLGIFLGSGTHEPTGVLFRWLIDNLPYFSLFRSPWYIFTPFLTLPLSGLTVLLLDRFYNYRVKVFVVFLMLGNIVYSYPLITGKIFRPDKVDGFFVNFPDYLFNATKFLAETDSGRVLTYPDDQLEKFKWGYIGVEPVISLLINKETIFSGINNTGSDVNKIIQLLYKNIRENNLSPVLNLAHKLNVSSILEKKDQHTLSPDFKLLSGKFGSTTLGDWKIYSLGDDQENAQKIYIGNSFYYQHSSSNDYAVKPLTLLSKDEHLLNPKDDVVKQVFPNKIPVGKIIVSNNSQKDNYLKFQELPNITLNRLTSEDMSKVKYTFEVAERGYYSPIIENYDIPRSLNKLNILHNLAVESWEVKEITDSHIYFKSIYLDAGSHEIIYKISTNLALSEDFENGTNYIEKTHQNEKAELTISENQNNKQLSILNRGNIDVSADFDLVNFDFNNPYFIQLDYEWSHGNMSTVYVNQHRGDSLIRTQTENLPSYPDKTSFNFYYEPVKTDSKTTISLAAPFINDSLGTRVAYDNIKIYKLFMNDLYFMQDSETQIKTPTVNIVKSSPVRYKGEVSGVESGHVLIFAENYSPDWKIKIVNEKDKQIPFRADHFTIDSYANAWFIDTGGLNYKFEIYYQPQIFFNIGLLISGLSVIFIFIIYAKNIKKN